MITQAQVTVEAPGELPKTRTSAFTYNTAGLVASETIEPGNGALSLTTTYGYDAFGNGTSKTVSGANIAARTEFQSFDPQGRFVITKKNALGHETKYEYDPRNGQPTEMTDPNGLVTTWDYDGFGRQGLEIRPDDTRTTITYSAITGGYRTVVASDGTAPIRTDFDILGREVLRGTIGFGGAWVFRDIRYDALGRVVWKSHPEFNALSPHGTSFAYDALGRVRTVTEAGNRTTITDYNGLTTAVTNALGQTRTTVKNSQGKVIEMTDAAGTTRYQYDPFLNLTQVTDVAGNVTTMSYDLRGRKIAMRDPDMGQWSYGYSALNELTSQTDAKGQTMTMTYDRLGRLQTRTTTEGTPTTSTWTYDSVPLGSTGRAALGRLASVTRPINGSSRTYGYDNLARTIRESTVIGATSFDVVHGYDAVGRHKTITYPMTGYTVEQEYDAHGHLWKVQRLNNGTRTLLWMTNAADAHARIIQEFFGNGVASNRAYHHETGDLQAIQTGTGANGAGLQNLSYTFDAIGKLLSRTDTITGVAESFGYDSLNRLTSANLTGPAGGVAKTYQYDAIGNLTFKSDVGTYSYPLSGPSSVRPHAVTAVSGAINATYTYDANGNMLSAGGGADGGTGGSAAGSSSGQLQNGVPLTGLAGTAGAELRYTFEVPAGATNLSFQLYGGSGDADLYVRYGSAPTFDTYDCRPFRDGNDELCGMTTATAGTWHVLVHAFTDFAEASLVVNYATTASSGGQLQNAVPLTALAGAWGEERRYTFEVPAGASNLSFQMAGGTGDADLHVRYGSPPTLNAFDCRPYEHGNDEVCDMASATAGTWHVLVHAFTDFDGASLVARYTEGAGGGSARSIEWTSFNKPYAITQNGQTTTLSYDADFNRLRKTTSTSTTVYVGKLYEQVTTGTLVEHKHYIYGGSSLVATYTSRNNGTAETKYVHTDHLGSINVLSNDSGQAAERLSFDPHGKRRPTNGLDATGTISSTINRGFTRHEHDDEVGLINMNARPYDPILGRFISPDSTIDGPTSQGLNRYSYVRNNPLSLTDPTGNFSLSRAIKRLTKNVKRVVNKWGRTIVAAVAAYYAFGYASDWMQAGVATTGTPTSFASAGTFIGTDTAGGIFSTSLTPIGGAVAGASSGFVSGGILSGNLQGAWKGATAGAISGGLFTAANNISSDWNAFGRITARATAGGLSARAQGGEFRDGFRIAGTFATGAYLYERAVGYVATWESGGDAVPKERLDYPVKGANNFGVQDNPKSWFAEGKFVSRALNVVPGFNAGAGMHDVFQVGLDQVGGAWVRNLFNLPGMPLAAALTAPALLDNIPGFITFQCVDHGCRY